MRRNVGLGQRSDWDAVWATVSFKRERRRDCCDEGEESESERQKKTTPTRGGIEQHGYTSTGNREQTPPSLRR